MKRILFFLLLLIVALAVVPLFLSKTLYVEEEYVFDLPTEQVYDYFGDLKKFTQFDNWSKVDPDIKIKFSSPAYGVGSFYEWESLNNKLGKGKLKISEAKENEFINYLLEFNDGKKSNSEVIFQRMDDGKTKAIWSFDSGEVGYPFQIFNLFMKGTVKENLHQGFVNLDSLIKNSSLAKFPNKDLTKGGFQVLEEPSRKFFGVMQQTTTSDEEMATAMSESLGLVYSYLNDYNQIEEDQIGDPVVYWKLYDTDANSAMFYCGFLLDKTVPEKDDMEYVEIPAGKVLTTIHTGSYDVIHVTYDRMKKFAEAHQLELSKSTYDIYLNDPTTTNEKELQVQIFIPILN